MAEVRAQMAGTDRFGPAQKKRNPLEDMYNLYSKSVEQQAGDYDDIMGRFKNIYANAGNRAGDFTPYTPTLANYDKSADTTSALANLKDLSETGGLSAGDQQNLRARGMSPIRSMYSTAFRDMDRNRRLSGGYSPNFGAVTAKLTRDMSSQIANQMDNVNAKIAEMVQSGKLSAAPNYASAAQAESELKNSFNMKNADAQNDAARFNAEGMFKAKSQSGDEKLAATKGMTDLYGTTPALSNLYGSQANQAAGMDQAKKRNNINTGMQAFNMLRR